MVTLRHETFQNIIFSVGIQAKNDPLNIPLFGFEQILLQKLRSYPLYKLLTKGLFHNKSLTKGLTRKSRLDFSSALVILYQKERGLAKVSLVGLLFPNSLAPSAFGFQACNE